jgi:tRNA(fMet)-specific endonuclease VapC
LRYLLDTNVCIALLTHRSLPARRRFASTGFADLAVSSVATFELWYGVANSAHVGANKARLTGFLAPLEIVEFDYDDSQRAGSLRHELERAGKPIGGFDLLIAAQALRRGLTVVTANEREFRRVPGLAVENWLTV